MAGKGTDRKGKSKEIKSAVNELEENLTTFTLPDSLPCSEIEFPILLKRSYNANWAEIIEESDKNLKSIENYRKSKMEILEKPPFLKTELDYIKDKIFIYLIPALEETLYKAQLWNALKIQKCFFNGIDHIVQILWNNNPRHPERKLDNLHLFNMPWVRLRLKET
ncbi:unnamed protein product [Euphydryas editha]|uniref:Uncharacterized protein n=1 Tax=Euphydryas editha TaxID=104508 RepID=A0AAU9TUE2_EUPED|nr:unnamed protein product [Euphydryas editha]